MSDDRNGSGLLTVIRYQERAVLPRRSKRAVPKGVSMHARYCSVFLAATSLGWDLCPPFDADVTWAGGRDFHVTTDDWLAAHLWRGQMAEFLGYPSPWWCSKISGVFQVDLGLTFKTKAGYKLLLGAPNNRPNPAYWTHVGLLDTDWFHVPSTVNLQLNCVGSSCQLRRDEPIAQITLISTAAATDEGFSVEDLSEGHPALEQWRDYIQEAFQGNVDERHSLERPKMGTYVRTKRRIEGAPF